MLQACLNGAREARTHAALPRSPGELAEDAAAVRAAGADELHIHVRDAEGAESLAPADVSAALRAVRAAVPGMPVGVSTGAWIRPGGAARLEHVRAWELLPDYASVNLSEQDAPDTMEALASRGVGIEAGLSTLADTRRFLALPGHRACLRVLIEIDLQEAEEAEAEALAILERLAAADLGRPLLLHGTDSCTWAMVGLAAARGLDTRIGLEDVLVMPDGRPAADNAALVSAARALLGGTGG
ncbi:3-keto-5-aminohexanoate cleavage protein [Oceanicella sp. SM1341]|uniref:3-keto-5-aminohexanoate cleavage protein n=1 Tax=Oceanicella sp. SM1341 TaxID=1548889 RepID=UPI000E509121|nr:3-keto-5-aminohexanoate cleavage protein [Oceanicella sp. SM1341]